VSFCGRRGWLFFRSRAGGQVLRGRDPTPPLATPVRIAKDATQGFLSGDYDEVYLAYNHFVNPLSQKPVHQEAAAHRAPRH
jgi:F0F1-type ATP synthase gamma subunit